MSDDAAIGSGAAAGVAGTSVFRAALSGLCASLIGVGLARFAYTPLIPVLIAAGWFLPADAVYLQAGNLAGYLAGALLARRAARRLSAIGALRANMALATLAFFACALPLSFLWYLVWRFAAGLSGGMLMVLAAPVVLPQVPAARRGILAVAPSPLALIPSSLVIGAFVPGSVVVVIGRTRELVANRPDRQQAAWSLATSAFALGQAIAAYGYSWLFALGLGHALLYAIGGAAFVVALAIDLAAARSPGR